MAAPEPFDAVVIGAGAAGLFFAWEAGKRGARVLVLDHAEKLGEKIRISGGGRCNFTNMRTEPKHFLSQNPKFAISALKSFTPKDFVKLVDAAGIAWHEKALGQLFCDGSAKEIIDMLLTGCREVSAEIRSGVVTEKIEKTADGFLVSWKGGAATAPRLIIATGGKSIPKIGATGFGYDVAQQFGINVIAPRPALVPLTFGGETQAMTSALSGVSLEASVTADPETQFGKKRSKKKTAFTDGFLFTHRGLSGPSILQISSYWREGGGVVIDFAPEADVFETLKAKRSENGRVALSTALGDTLPKRLAQQLAATEGWTGNLADWSDAKLRGVADRLHHFRVVPTGSEGYRTAEVTLGGVDTAGLNSKTMEAHDVPGLYFIGEVVDVTGWLGGYNFQWAWASAHASARAVTAG